MSCVSNRMESQRGSLPLRTPVYAGGCGWMQEEARSASARNFPSLAPESDRMAQEDGAGCWRERFESTRGRCLKRIDGFFYCAAALAMLVAQSGSAKEWSPPAGIEQIPLWPDKATIARPEVKGEESARLGETKIAGRPVTGVENVVRPTMSVFPAKGANTGAAVVVFPGGGYRILAIDFEGTEVCDWLNIIHVTCILLKYRVPDSGPLPKSSAALQDAQRALALVRS